MAKRVIIIDDSKYTIREFKKFLEAKGSFDILGEGYDGDAAVELYKKFRPDVVFMDITMPNKDGFTAMEEILAFDPAAKVIIMSAVRGKQMREILKNGAKAYIEKPLSMKSDEFSDDFDDAIEQVFK